MSEATSGIAWDHPDPFIYKTVVEKQHIDDFQHTNNVVYLTWMAKTAWEHSKALGLDFAAYAKINRGMVVRRHELEYLAASRDRKSTRLNSSHVKISYAVFCLKKKKYYQTI